MTLHGPRALHGRQNDPEALPETGTLPVMAFKWKSKRL